jgi:hypothetical protein
MDLLGPAASAVGREIVAAIESRDWGRLAECMSPAVQFRAVVPSRTEPFREHLGPDAACAQIARWFDGGDIYELIGHEIDVVADRLHVSYTVQGRDDGTWYLVEQHIFATLAGDRISHLNLVCSGFRDTQPPDGRVR